MRVTLKSWDEATVVRTGDLTNKCEEVTFDLCRLGSCNKSTKGALNTTY